MNASELHRKLLFKGHNELSTFLEESPINYVLYQFMRDVKPRYQINHSMVDILNEVYFVCIRANRDLTPGDNITERYIAEEKAWMGVSLATELVFCLVYIVCKLQKKLSYPLDCFTKGIYPFTSNSTFFQDTKDFISMTMAKDDMLFETDFTPQPVSAKELQEAFKEPAVLTFIDQIMQDYSQPVNPWRVVTNNYAQTAILDFLRCYHSKDDQCALLELIKESATPNERKDMDGFYTETFELIGLGEYLPRMLEKPAETVSADNDNRKLSVAYQQIEYLQQQLADLKAAHVTELSEQRANFDRRLAKIEAQYKADLATNKQAIEAEVKTKTEPTDPFFTLAELVDHARLQCFRQGAEAISAMLYRLAVKHRFTDETTLALIDSIIPAIDQREANHQTFDMPNVQQFNNNPQTVNNYGNQD